MIDTVIVLAAGRGTRLQPLTTGLPKGMVPLHGRPLLAWQLDAVRAAGVRRVVVVRGYEAGKIDLPGVEYVTNERFAETNMVASLLEAERYFEDGFVLAYSDIVYEPWVLEAVRASEAPVTCAVDLDWEPYWSQRFGDPLVDAETLRMEDGRIVEIGQRPRSTQEIEGQFVGLVAFQGAGLAALRAVADDARRLQGSGRTLPDCPRTLDGLYTTDLLQELARRDHPPAAAVVHGGWLEIDDLDDHRLAERLTSVQDGELRIRRAAVV